MGGLVNSTTVKGDLWMIDLTNGSMTCYPVNTVAEGPGPRVGHASLLVGNAFIVFGGDTKLEDGDELDDTLYLLNTCEYAARVKAVTNFSSIKTVVSGVTKWTKTVWPLRSHSQHSRIQNIYLWWPG
jgi:hypothetical protein